MRKSIILAIAVTAIVSATTTYTVATHNTKTDQVIPYEDISGYFYDDYGYLCYEIKDTYKNSANGNSYRNISRNFDHLTEIETIQTYQLTGEITNIKGKTITVFDTNGNKWKFRGDGYTKGKTVKMLMDKNGTDDITDDAVLETN